MQHEFILNVTHHEWMLLHNMSDVISAHLCHSHIQTSKEFHLKVESLIRFLHKPLICISCAFYFKELLHLPADSNGQPMTSKRIPGT